VIAPATLERSFEQALILNCLADIQGDRPIWLTGRRYHECERSDSVPSRSRNQSGRVRKMRGVLHCRTGWPLGGWVTLALFLPPVRGADQTKRRHNEAKRQEKANQARLSRNSQFTLDPTSGHHLQLDDPRLVIDAIRRVVEAARRVGLAVDVVAAQVLAPQSQPRLAHDALVGHLLTQLGAPAFEEATVLGRSRPIMAD